MLLWMARYSSTLAKIKLNVHTGTFLDYGPSAGDTTTMAYTNLIGPLELSTPLHLYYKDLPSLYVRLQTIANILAP